MMGKIWRGSHPVVKMILIGTVLTYTGLGLIIPYFAIYLGEYTSLSISQTAFLIGAGSLAAMFGGFLGGTISDLIGRKSVMIVSLSLSSFIILGFTLHSFSTLLMVLTVLKGLSLSLFDPTSKALIGDLTESEKRLGTFTLKYFCGNLGFAIGPLIGTFLGFTELSTLPFNIAFGIFFGYSLLLNFVLIRYRITKIEGQTEKLTFRTSMVALGKDKKLLLFLVGGMLATAVHGQFSVTLSQYFFQEMKSGLKFLGVLWSAHSITILVLCIPISKFMEKRTSFQSIIFGTIFFIMGIVGFAVSNHFPSFLVSMIIFTIGEIFLIPAEYSIIDEITPSHIRGTYFGAASFTALGSFLGPGISGFLLTQFNSGMMFLFLSLVLVVSLLFYFWGVYLAPSKTIVETNFKT